MIAGTSLWLAVHLFLLPLGGRLTDVYNCHGHKVIACRAYLVGVPVVIDGVTQHDPMNLTIAARRVAGRWVISGGLF